MRTSQITYLSVVAAASSVMAVAPLVAAASPVAVANAVTTTTAVDGVHGAAIDRRCGVFFGAGEIGSTLTSRTSTSLNALRS